jgi:trans-aconitate 2-methyltransferase
MVPRPVEILDVETTSAHAGVVAWDPARYLEYADERSRPFVELMARVRAENPETVVDLGCGAGNLTDLLAARWPLARVVGIDSSPEMVARARAGDSWVDYRVADLRAWVTGDEGADVVVSNAALQWVPGHLDLLPELVERVGPGGWLAFQVPGNFDQPSHTLREELAAESPYAEHLGSVATPRAHDAATYLDALVGLGCEVDVWETTYLHVLHGEDPVLAWVSGTSLRPTLAALPTELRAEFEARLRRRLREAYPPGPRGTVMPFRRVFVVATR